MGVLVSKFVERTADGKSIILGKKSGNRRRRVELATFFAAKSVPKNACLPCWLSSYNCPHAMCDWEEVCTVIVRWPCGGPCHRKARHAPRPRRMAQEVAHSALLVAAGASSGSGFSS